MWHCESSSHYLSERACACCHISDGQQEKCLQVGGFRGWLHSFSATCACVVTLYCAFKKQEVRSRINRLLCYLAAFENNPKYPEWGFILISSAILSQPNQSNQPKHFLLQATVTHSDSALPLKWFLTYSHWQMIWDQFGVQPLSQKHFDPCLS